MVSCLDEAGLQKVLDVQQTHRPAPSVNDDQLVDLVLLEKPQRLHRQAIRPDRFRMTGHHVADALLGQVAGRVEVAPQIPVREDADEAPARVDDAGAARARFRDRQQHLFDARLLADDGVGFAHPHEVADAEQEAAPQLARRMEQRKVALLELLPLCDDHRHGVAHREHSRRGGGRGQVERAGFASHAYIEDDVAVVRQRGARVSGEHDEAGADALDDRQEPGELFGLAAIRQGDHHVVFRDSPQIAVDGFSRVDPVAGRAGRGERRRELLADEAGLAHPRHDDAALAAGEQGDRLLKVLADPRDEPADRLRLNPQHLAGTTDTHNESRTH